MPQNQSSKALIHLHEPDPSDDLGEHVPAVSITEIFARAHIPPFAEYLRTNPAPFNLLTYLHRISQYLVEALEAGFSHQHIFDFLVRQHPQPFPVRYRRFSRGLEIFREQKGMRQAKPRSKRSAPAAARVNADSRLTQAAASSLPVPLKSPPPVPEEPRLSVPAVTRPAVDDSTISAEERETREIEARLARRFRPFTAEDARSGKPIMEAIADKERQDLEEYERGLKDGTITD